MGDTIAAIATAMNPSGIGIVRISGDEAVEIAGKIYRSKSGKKDLNKVESHTIHYGFIIEQEQEIDEVLVMIMRGPRSYTGEDTVEIDCHGGVLAVKKVLETVIRHGARLAEPGEFTKRAFLNGKMDLSQAEAVMDLIQAKSDYALKSSMSQLKGSVHRAIEKIRGQILYEIAFIESALDDPEHISIDGYGEKLDSVVDNILQKTDRLLKTSGDGKMIQEGIRTVIVGKPNAGKSSLLNMLLGEERAIVTDIAGTTRDTLEETISLQGISLRMVDTAGIRDTSDVVEKIGVEKARASLENADLVLYVVDSSVPLDENDEEIIHLLEDKKAIVLLNKTDLEASVSEQVMEEKMVKEGMNHKILSISAREERGLDLLEACIKDMFFKGNISFNDQVYITNIRHKRELEEAVRSLGLVKQSIEMDMPEDFYSIDLMNAYDALGRIIGASGGEDLVNEIFSKFCTGK